MFRLAAPCTLAVIVRNASRVLFAVCLLLVCAPLSFSQITQVTDDQTTPIAGAGHNYISSVNETVNPANGSVSFRLDLDPPKGRGLTLPLISAYDSNGAVHAVAKYPSPQQASWTDNNGFGYGGWSLTLPMLSWSARTVTDPHNQNNVCNYVTGFVFQDPTGGRHFLGMLGQLATSNDCPALGVPTPTLTGGSDIYTAVATSPDAALVMVTDITTGTAYSFNTGGLGSQTYTTASFVEDSNGNRVTINSSIADTLGRTIALGNVQFPGMNPYAFNTTMETSGTHPVNQSADSSNPPYCPANPIVPYGISNTVVTSITLPETSLEYQFGYDSASGLLNQITYPNGAWVKYTWGLNSYADHIYVADDMGDKGVACGYTYDVYAVTERQVSYDGVTVALTQTFSYTTDWNYANDGDAFKTTTVTNVDNVTNTTTKIIYTYGAVDPPNGPYDTFSGQLVVPVEVSIQYQDNNGNTLRTVNKSWAAQSEMTCQSVTQNGSTSRIDYNPYALYPWPISKKEWDWGAPACGSATSGSPLRETDYTVTGFNVQVYAATYWPNSTDPVFGRPTVVTVMNNGVQTAQTKYTYDDSGKLTPVSPSITVGRDTKYNGTGITARGNVTSKLEWVNTTNTFLPWYYTNDDTGQRLTAKDPKSNSTGYSYTDSFSTDCDSPGAPGATNAFLTKITDAKSFTETFKYRYCDGQLSSLVDWNSQTASYLYADPFFRLTKTTDPDTGTVTNTYNDTGSTPSVATSQTMDASTTNATTKVMDAIGHVTRTQLNSDPDCSGGADNTDTVYDGLGRVYTVSNPYCSTSPDPHTAGVTTTLYDAAGRTVSVASPDGPSGGPGSTTTTSYSQNTTTITDPAGHIRKLTYDGIGRLTNAVEDPNGLNYSTGYRYSYDTSGNLDFVVTQGSQTRTFIYDSLSRLTSATNPESGTTTYTYPTPSSLCSGDPSEPCTRRDARSISTTYLYLDPLNRVTQKSYSDGTAAANFYYDEASVSLGSWASGSLNNYKRRLTHTTTVNSGGTKLTATVQDYDAMGRTKDYWQCSPVNCATSTIWSSNYQYKYTGEVSQWLHPAGFTLTNTVSAARRIKQIQSSLVDTYHPQYPVQSITYMPWGAVSTFVNGNTGSGSNAQETYIYNKRLQPWMIDLGTTTTPTADYCQVYNYYSSWTAPTTCPAPSQLAPTGTTDNGTVMGDWYQDSVNTSFSHTSGYTYDTANRLTNASATGNSTYNLPFSYTQDGSTGQYGNMTCVINAQTVGLCYPLSFSSSTNHVSGYSYDLAGNVTNSGAHTYQWDAEERMAVVDPGTTPTWTFTYNALGHRVQWVGKSSTEQHLFDPAGGWLGVAGAYSLVRFGDRHILVSSATGVNFNHVNALGSTTMMTNQVGSPVEDMVFYPWGDAWLSAGSGGYDFASMPYYDLATNSDFTTARAYGNDYGRWFSPDPAGKGAVHLDDPQTWNMYGYVRNSPATLTDPSGQCDWCQRLLNAATGGGFVSDAELASSIQRTPETNKPPGLNQKARTALMTVTRPSKRTETVYQIAGIVNHETGGMSDSKSENTPLSTAREQIADVRINGDQKWGDAVDANAKMAPPIYGGRDFGASLDAAANAAWDQLNGTSQTGGATNYRMWGSMDDAGPYWGMPVYTTDGPYLSPTSNTVISTYGPNIE